MFAGQFAALRSNVCAELRVSESSVRASIKGWDGLFRIWVAWVWGVWGFRLLGVSGLMGIGFGALEAAECTLHRDLRRGRERLSRKTQR